MTKAITGKDCQIVRDLHGEGLSDTMIAIRFDTTPDRVRAVLDGGHNNEDHETITDSRYI